LPITWSQISIAYYRCLWWRHACKGAHILFTGQRERERLNFYACKGAHTHFTGQRERGRKREIKREREKERKRCRIWLFLFLKGLTGALAPFSFLVYYNTLKLVFMILSQSLFSLRYTLEFADTWCGDIYHYFL
jgi:hypothetical protein